MTGLRYHLPPDRAVITVAGEDRQAFLQGLISNDTAKIAPDRAIYATLLTAQGRFLFDLFIAGRTGRYLVDCATPRRADLVKRLSMYRLRSKVTIADADADWCVALLFGDGAGDSDRPWPRVPAAPRRSAAASPMSTPACRTSACGWSCRASRRARRWRG